MKIDKLGRILAIIPAKAASKRLLRKNLKLLGGLSLLGWTTRVAVASQIFDQIIVSTEDIDVAKEARLLGVDVPFIRPQKLSVDPAGVEDVCLHALDELEAQSQFFDTLVILLPSSPFRAVKDIHGSLKKYVEKNVGFLMSVSDLEHSPLTALIMNSQGFLNPLHPEWINKSGAKINPDEIPHLVRCNGAITIVDVKQFKEKRKYYSYPLAAYTMPFYRGLDIDTEQDLIFAEFLLKQNLIKEQDLIETQ